jgi:hypothetical protein
MVTIGMQSIKNNGMPAEVTNSHRNQPLVAGTFLKKNT